MIESLSLLSNISEIFNLAVSNFFRKRIFQKILLEFHFLTQSFNCVMLDTQIYLSISLLFRFYFFIFFNIFNFTSFSNIQAIIFFTTPTFIIDTFVVIILTIGVIIIVFVLLS